jgi:hypothetical protein
MGPFWTQVSKIIAHSFLRNGSFLFLDSLYSLCVLLIVCREGFKGHFEGILGKIWENSGSGEGGQERLGMTQKDSAAAICKDYALPLTPDQYIKEITPMYREK